MKHTLTLTLAILLLAATGRGDTNKTTKVTFDPVAFPKLPADFVLELTTHTATNNYIPPSPSFIRKLAASGAICKVFGHWYPNVWIGEHKCVLCGKVEPNWRDK